jgi:prepilin-type N-terminal cleavage/methylation domain-containing protein
MESCPLIIRNSHMNGERGVTLVEVVIATAIMLIITGAIIQLFISHLRAGQATENYMLVSEHNQRALQKMAEEIKGTDYELVNVSFSGSQGSKTLPPIWPGGSSVTVILYDSITFKKILGFDTVS